MADNRKKMLEALAAKRKAEAQGTTDRHKKSSSASSLLAKPSAKLKSSPGADKKHSPAPVKKKDSPASIQKHKPAQEAANPKKKRRVEKYESEDDDEDEESDGSLSSEEEDYKKPAAKPAKGHPAPSSKGKPSVPNGKGKEPGKEKAKKKKANSDSDEVGSDEEVASDASDDFGVDPSNILPSRTRRSQGVRYDFTGMSDGDDDSD